VRLAGGDNRPAVFLFSDTQIKAESFVEDINNLLNSGEVGPGGAGRVCVPVGAGGRGPEGRSYWQAHGGQDDIKQGTLARAHIGSTSFLGGHAGATASPPDIVLYRRPRSPPCPSLPRQVPNMFPYDERAAVLEQCRASSKKEGLVLDSAVELWGYFVDKTRDNLHIVLAMSPIGNAFRDRLRQFPSLVNCCTVDW
jgi:hypothetical protein